MSAAPLHDVSITTIQQVHATRWVVESRSTAAAPPSITSILDTHKENAAKENSAAVAALQSLLAKTIDEIARYKTFGTGWDGYRGVPFSERTVRDSTVLVNFIYRFFRERGKIPNKLTPGPASDGSIDVDVRFRNRSLLFTLEAGEVESVGVFAEDTNDPNQASETRDPFNPASVEVRLAWLVG